MGTELKDRAGCEWCVGWDGCAFCVATFGQLLEHNAGAVLDGKPGIAVVRASLTSDQAERYVKAFSPLAKRITGDLS